MTNLIIYSIIISIYCILATILVIILNKDKAKLNEKYELTQILNKKKNEVDFNRIQLLMNSENPMEKINTILDNIIDNYIKLYQVQNPSLDGSYQYIKTDEVNNVILPYVYFMTMKSMTPEVISLLSLVYVFKDFNLDEFLRTRTIDNFKPANDDTNTLEWVVFTRVNLSVINFVNDINQ